MTATLHPDDRQLVREAVRDAVDRHASAERTRELVDGAADDVREVWQRLNTGLGLTAIPVPEALGGAGAGWAAAGIALEELGRTLYPAPYLTSCLAIRLLLGSDTAEARGLLTRIAGGDVVATVVFGSTGDGPVRGAGAGVRTSGSVDATVSGTVEDVLGADLADVLLVAADGPDGPVVLAVEAAVATIRSRPTLDPTRPLFSISLVDAPGVRMTSGSVGALLADVAAFGAALQAAEAVGGAAQCLDLAVGHVRERSQFGVPIGSFQAVKHACADLVGELEPARSAAYGAMEAADGDDGGHLLEAASLAKVVSDRMYPRVALESVQLHGAMGFTWDMGLHLHVRRAVCNRAMFGEARWHRARLAGRVAALAGRAPMSVDRSGGAV